jgi:hypothetical protein
LPFVNKVAVCSERAVLSELVGLQAGVCALTCPPACRQASKARMNDEKVNERRERGFILILPSISEPECCPLVLKTSAPGNLSHLNLNQIVFSVRQ